MLQQLTDETAVSNDEPDFPSTAALVGGVEVWCQKGPLRISSPAYQGEGNLKPLSQLLLVLTLRRDFLRGESSMVGELLRLAQLSV